MARIFISYRRDDTSGYAGRVYDRFVSHFGANNVFMDIDSLEPGTDFLEALKNMVPTCEVLLAVIGRQWLNVTDHEGRSRLGDSGARRTSLRGEAEQRSGLMPNTIPG
jgi:hypothetical protein